MQLQKKVAVLGIILREKTGFYMHRETRFFLYLRYFKDYKKFSKARKQFFKFYQVRFTFKNQELVITSSALELRSFLRTEMLVSL